MLAHDVSRQPDRRSGRHFYDVFQLLGDGRVLELLTDPERVEEVVASIEAITREHFGGDHHEEVRPVEGFATSVAFDLGTDVSERLRVAYEATMPELYFGADPLPTWETICARVAELRELL